MPQITLEYTTNLNPPQPFAMLFEDVHQALHRIGGINLDNCKSRAGAVENYFIADGTDDHAFVHLQIRFMEGRSDEVKQELGNGILKLLKHWFGVEQDRRRIQVTVEIGDIRRDEYFKFPEGTLTEI